MQVSQVYHGGSPFARGMGWGGGAGALSGNETFLMVNNEPTAPNSRQTKIDQGLFLTDFGALDRFSIQHGIPELHDTTSMYSPFWPDTQPITVGDWIWSGASVGMEGVAENNTANIYAADLWSNADHAFRFDTYGITGPTLLVGFGFQGANDTYAEISYDYTTGIITATYSIDGGPVYTQTVTVATSARIWLRLRRWGDKIEYFYFVSEVSQGIEEVPNWVKIVEFGSRAEPIENYFTAYILSCIGATFDKTILHHKQEYVNSALNLTSGAGIVHVFSAKTGQRLDLRALEQGTGITLTQASTKITIANSIVTFLALTDTPAAYTGAALKYLRVNAGETAVEFQTFPTLVTTFLALSDTPASYASQALKYLRVNAGETAVEFQTFPALVTTFIGLSDTPGNYTGEVGGRTVRVNSGKTALEYVRSGVAFPSTLTDAATVAVDLAKGDIYRLLATGAVGNTRVLGNPTNPVDGQKWIFSFKQDGTGGRNVTFDTKYAFSTDLPSPTLTKSINKTAKFGFIYNSSDDKHYLISFLQEF